VLIFLTANTNLHLLLVYLKSLKYEIEMKEILDQGVILDLVNLEFWHQKEKKIKWKKKKKRMKKIKKKKKII